MMLRQGLKIQGSAPTVLFPPQTLFIYIIATLTIRLQINRTMSCKVRIISGDWQVWSRRYA
jgi:hypothetical protein